MAVAFVGEAFLSASVEVLLERIVSNEFLHLFRSSKELDVSLLKRLKITLLSLQVMLNDAEEKQITNPAIKEWVDELTHALYDADDLLDEIHTETLRCKVEAVSQSQPISDQVRNFFSYPFKSHIGVINSEIQAVFQRLEQFSLQKDILGLREGVTSRAWHGTPTSSVIDESTIYGRDDDKRILKGYLLSEEDDGSGSKIGVITIVGMGGLGKTTLAKLLYNDHDVKEKFDLKAWAYISKDFDVCRVTKSLLETVSSKSVVTNNLNTLQVELQQSLCNKRFLLVLDDIWDGSYDDWNKLKAIFQAGERGSKIIITTRHENVALAMQTFLPIHYLRSLHTEDCWSLLAHHAFGATNCRKQSKLEVIGKKIAKRCGGLPLAAEALGGLLRTKLHKKEWNRVLKSNIWDLPNVNVLPALLLSYHYLPAPLKRCFAYCSIFPKNSILDKSMMVQLWIAEGLVHRSRSSKSPEEVGDEYFDELVSRSLIRQHTKENFVMHDLINELATMVSSTYCIRHEDPMPHENLERVRHLSYNRGRYDCFNKFDTLNGTKCLRTFVALPSRHWWSLKYPNLRSHYLSNKLIFDMLPAMKRLRVLSLSHYNNITGVPDSLGNLTHLRYLDLSNTKIERLPDTTCRLYNLQTLLLSKCWLLVELPEKIGNLVNLRHLDISGTQLKEMPVQIAELKNLQMLSNFVVSKQQDGLKVSELRKFPDLQGKLSISKLQNVTDPSEAFQANLNKKEQIDELELKWNHDSSEDSQVERLVLEKLQPSTNIKKLSIQSYGGTSFPNWLGDSSFSKMVYLRISGCDYCWSLPPLGQLLSLKKLIISGLKSITTVGMEFYGSCCSNSGTVSFQPFPSLEILSFLEMPEWEEWNSIQATTFAEFPNLKRLYLCDCPKLKGNLPNKLPSLTELELSQCAMLNSDSTGSFTRPLTTLSHYSLKELTFSGISSPTSFPALPLTLQSLTFLSCRNLQFLTYESLPRYTSLENLHLFNSCDSMTSFPLGSFPVLKSLFILGCKNLKHVTVTQCASPQSLSCLVSLSIYACPNLETFPDIGSLATPNLNNFLVSTCGKLHSLPDPIGALSGLHQLSAYGLPNLRAFAEGGLPAHLRTLEISRCGSLATSAIANWGLQALSCLAELRVRGDGLVNALMKMNAPLLPTSIVSLRISHLYYIKCLEGKWLRHLTNLESVEISDCRRLESLPEEGMPSSISVLTIKRCVLLEASCQSNEGRDWKKIAHIPCVIVNNRVII